MASEKIVEVMDVDPFDLSIHFNVFEAGLEPLSDQSRRDAGVGGGFFDREPDMNNDGLRHGESSQCEVEVDLHTTELRLLRHKRGGDP